MDRRLWTAHVRFLIEFRKIKLFASWLSNTVRRNGRLSQKNYAVKATMNAPESSAEKGILANYVDGTII
jgi:hypothetical protein